MLSEASGLKFINETDLDDEAAEIIFVEILRYLSGSIDRMTVRGELGQRRPVPLPQPPSVRDFKITQCAKHRNKFVLRRVNS